jgi:hypothetical protein
MSEEAESSSPERLSELHGGHIGRIVTVNPGSSYSVSGRLREIRHYIVENEPRTSLVVTWSGSTPPVVVDVESWNLVEVRPPHGFKITADE